MSDSEPNVLDRPKGLMRSELQVLRDLVRSSRATRILEVGMANGSSTVAMLSTLAGADGGRVTSIDPFQLVAPIDGVPGYGGAGVKSVREMHLEHLHTLITEPDYLALPSLVRQGQHFDLVFIDGYHSFDYVMLDVFYADLLLVPGGTMVLHDSGRLPVFRAIQFLVFNRPYARVGPPLLIVLDSQFRRALRRVLHIVTGRAARFRDRRDRWKSLAAFVKLADQMADEISLRGV